MPIMKVFDIDSWKRSSKKQALERLLVKLQRRRRQIEARLTVAEADRQGKKLHVDLRVNGQHILKAKRLLIELDEPTDDDHGARAWRWPWQPAFGDAHAGASVWPLAEAPARPAAAAPASKSSGSKDWIAAYSDDHRR